MRSEKKQRFEFNQETNAVNKPPTWRPAGRKRARATTTDDPLIPYKKVHTMNKTRILEALSNEMEIRLDRKI